jgi:hypothetical protein
MNKLDEAIAVIKAGDIERGRRLLVEVLDEDPRNAKAWLWMSGVVSDPERRRQSLLAVLEIEPDNEIARRGLEKFGWLEEEPVAELPPTAPFEEALESPVGEEEETFYAAGDEEESDLPLVEEDARYAAAVEDELYSPLDEDLFGAAPGDELEPAFDLALDEAPAARPVLTKPVQTPGRGIRFTWLVIALLVLLLVVVALVALYLQ